MIPYIVILFMTGFLSCCDDMGPVDPPPPIKIFDLQWAEKLEENYEVVTLANGHIFKDWFLVQGDLDDPFKFYAFNTTTGNKDWTFVNEGNVTDNINISQVEGSTYIGISSKGMVAVNLETQTRIWEVEFSDLNYYANNSNTIYKGYLYHNFSVGGVGLDSEAAVIGRFNLVNGSYEELYRATNDAEGLKTNSPPAVYTADNGHDIMVFNERPDDGAPPENKQEIVAYDIIDDAELWRTKDFTSFYASNGLHPPIIYNKDLVITGGDWSMYAFDLETGIQQWKTSVPGYDKFAIWRATNHLIKNDRLYVNPNGLEIMCLNPMDGSVIWQNLTDAPSSSDNMFYYEKEDYLVFTSWGLGSVMVLDAFTGEKIHREHEFDFSSYNKDTVYDPATDMFFTCTYKHAIGFKIIAPE